MGRMATGIWLRAKDRDIAGDVSSLSKTLITIYVCKNLVQNSTTKRLEASQCPCIHACLHMIGLAIHKLHQLFAQGRPGCITRTVEVGESLAKED